MAGVAGVVLFAWRSFSPLGGLVAGLVYATNPWAVFYARKVWAQDMLAPVAVLLFIALERFLQQLPGATPSAARLRRATLQL